jgi:hypothetical protein
MLWMNDGTGHFSDETAARLPVALNNSTEVDFADIDGDDDLDAVVSGLGPNQLLENDGDGFFTDVSAQLPQATPPGPPGFGVPFPPFFIEISAEAVFVDVDGDDDPDILISNENPFPFGPPGDQNRILIKDGSGNFSDETAGRLPFGIDNTAGSPAGSTSPVCRRPTAPSVSSCAATATCARASACRAFWTGSAPPPPGSTRRPPPRAT